MHIGESNYIFKDDIIAILDRKCLESTSLSKEFIHGAIEDNCLIGKLDSSIKTYILVSQYNKIIIYTSAISSKALAKRSSW